MSRNYIVSSLSLKHITGCKSRAVCYNFRGETVALIVCKRVMMEVRIG